MDDDPHSSDKKDESQDSRDDRHTHEGFMREAIKMVKIFSPQCVLPNLYLRSQVTCANVNQAELALATDETPVGCVFVHEGQIIGRGMNATNRTMNGTRHAEFMAIANILESRAIPAGEQEMLYDPSILKECDVYVTVEPCIMCASLLRQYGVRKVYFGATNERFGGTGGVLNIHDEPGVEAGFPVSGGWLREEAIMLLRRFYVQENEKGMSIRV
jgi:tRNA-specific adenosine deaminase 2